MSETTRQHTSYDEGKQELKLLSDKMTDIEKRIEALRSFPPPSSSKENGTSAKISTSSTPRPLSVKFTINNGKTVTGQYLYVVGDNAKLGDGKETQGFRLAPTSYPTWSGETTIDLFDGHPLKFKYYKMFEGKPETVVNDPECSFTVTPGSNSSFSHEATWKSA
eukprot:TRINITY_DN1351_c0_g1_i1.p1 TRINITY_DN1351_c0_g1~~TRINITY_DN1351_c0_g1_i1.p1  ORF type:complete len:164 (+),score=53.85 TRINITY_DN1351_c0_g1_i1:49-540(+)